MTIWEQIVQRKNEWIGGTLFEDGPTSGDRTTIVDITLEPTGLAADHPQPFFFSVIGREFTCGGDIRWLSVEVKTLGEHGGPLTFMSYGGHTWGISPAEGAKV